MDQECHYHCEFSKLSPHIIIILYRSKKTSALKSNGRVAKQGRDHREQAGRHQKPGCRLVNDIMSSCHSVISLCHHFIVSLCMCRRVVVESFCVIVSFCYCCVIVSSCHLVIVSPFCGVILWVVESLYHCVVL